MSSVFKGTCRKEQPQQRSYMITSVFKKEEILDFSMPEKVYMENGGIWNRNWWLKRLEIESPVSGIFIQDFFSKMLQSSSGTVPRLTLISLLLSLIERHRSNNLAKNNSVNKPKVPLWMQTWVSPERNWLYSHLKIVLGEGMQGSYLRILFFLDRPHYALSSQYFFNVSLRP